MARQTIGTMSGGEKARVALSMFVLVPHNLLLLDEPSNHLDVGALDALTDALVEYTGIIFTSGRGRERGHGRACTPPRTARRRARCAVCAAWRGCA